MYVKEDKENLANSLTEQRKSKSMRVIQPEGRSFKLLGFIVLRYGKLDCARVTVWLTSMRFITGCFHQGPSVSPDTFTDHLLRTHSPTPAEIAPKSSCLLPSTAKASHSFVSSRRFLKLACGPVMHDLIFLCFPPLSVDLSAEKLPGKMKHLYSCRGLLPVL